MNMVASLTPLAVGVLHGGFSPVHQMFSTFVRRIVTELIQKLATSETVTPINSPETDSRIWVR